MFRRKIMAELEAWKNSSGKKTKMRYLVNTKILKV